jgi:hypothetical protein
MAMINTSSYGAAVGSDDDVHVSFSYMPSDAGSITGSDGGTATMQGPSWGSTGRHPRMVAVEELKVPLREP